MSFLKFMLPCFCLFFSACCHVGHTDSVRSAFKERNPDFERYELFPTSVHQIEKTMNLKYGLRKQEYEEIFELTENMEDLASYVGIRMGHLKDDRVQDQGYLSEIEAAMEPGDELFEYIYQKEDGRVDNGLMIINQKGEIKFRNKMYLAIRFYF